MRASIWTYPWDVDDLGLDHVAAELRDRAGAQQISLAASYHAGRFLQPRSPRRRSYFPEDGTIYFRPDRARWAGSAITPQTASVLDHADPLRLAIEARERSSLAVGAWTVCLHNTRLGLLHPGVVTRNAFGDPYRYSLCPSHPDARAYVRTLVADLTHSYRVDVVELETPGFMPFAHEFHHEKDGVGLAAEEDFLLSLCFCGACEERAQAAGVDVVAARTTVCRLIDDALGRAVPAPRWPGFLDRGTDALAEFPALAAYVAWRSEPVMSLIGEIRAAAHPDSRVVVIDLAAGWLGGVDTAGLAAVCDGLILCCYDATLERIERDVARARALLGPERLLTAGFRLFYPETDGPAILGDRVRAATKAGCDGLSFYNYGLVPAPRLDWVRKALDLS